MIIIQQNKILHMVARKPGVEGGFAPHPRLARSLFAFLRI